MNLGATAVQAIELNKRIANALNEPDPFPDKDTYEEHVRTAQNLQSFAIAQKERQFAYLWSLCAFRLWTILEHLVDDIVIVALKDVTPNYDLRLLQSLRAPVLDFVQLSPDQRAEELLRLLEEKISIWKQKGVGRLECLLEPISLSGAVDDIVKDTLYELIEVRHLIAHRAGHIDNRLKTNCPWIRGNEGDELTLTEERYHAYFMATAWYIMAVWTRLLLKCNEDVKSLNELLHELAQKVRTARDATEKDTTAKTN